MSDQLSNTDELRRIMANHGLTRTMIAELIDVSPHTVSAWLLPPQSKRHRPMADRDIDYLRLKTKS